MIISASYKTDIPAFYGEWFERRLSAGSVGMVNPYNRQPYSIPLDRESVSGFVFWTKNLRPFLKRLPRVVEFGRPACVQFTINGYPKALESAVVEWEKSVDAARQARELLGDRSIVWRYDTVIFSRMTPKEWHTENFQRIADAMAGLTDEVVISFLQVYRKTRINMDKAAKELDNPWEMPDVEEQREFASALAQLASERNIELTICSQPALLTSQRPSRCIDNVRLSDLAGEDIAAKTKGNRPGCECAESKDIGDYDTCPHGCIYCYAVRSQELAIKRFKEHDPSSEFLYPVDIAPNIKLLEVKNDPNQRRFDL